MVAIFIARNCREKGASMMSEGRNIDMVWNMVRPAGEPVRILHLTLILYFRTM